MSLCLLKKFMNKNFLVIVAFIFWILTAIMLYLNINSTQQFLNIDQEYDDQEFDFYVKNKDRSDSYFVDIPFRKNDSMVYLFIFSPAERVSQVVYEENKLANLLKLENIDIESNINTLETESIVSVFVEWNAESNWNTQQIEKSRIPDNFSYSFEENQEESKQISAEDSSDTENQSNTDEEPTKQEQWNYNTADTSEDDSEFENDIDLYESVEEEEEIDENSEEGQVEGIEFSSTNLYAGTDNLVTLQWDLEGIESVGIWENIYPIEQEQDEYVIDIPSDDFGQGEYFIFKVDEFWNLEDTWKQMSFFDSEWDLYISKIIPDNMPYWEWRVVTLLWWWFDDIISVQISDNQILENTDYEVVSDNTMRVRIPSDIEKWNYFFNMMTQERIYETDYMQFEVY